MRRSVPVIFTAFVLATAGACSGDGRANGLPDGNLFLSDWFLNIAHRGGSVTVPEETMVAFQSAVDIGADVLEMDLHATSDGVVVCMHDYSVDRTTDGTGNIKDMTFDELRRLDAGFRFNPGGGPSYPYRGRGVVVPAFEEVLDAFGDCYFVAEIKQANPPIVDAVLDILERTDTVSRVILAAADDNVMEGVREKNPDVFTSYAFGEMLTFATLEEADERTYRPPAIFLHPPSEVVDAEFIKRARRFDLKVHAWTVNDRPTMERLINLNIDGIITDDPDLLEDVVEDLRLHSQ